MAQFSEMGENFLLLPIFLLPLLYFILKQLKSSDKPKTSLPLPPGPTPWPILGNATQIDQVTPASLLSLSKTYGPLFMIRLGTQYMAVGSSPEAATEILRTYDRLLSARFVPDAVPPELFKADKSSISWAETCDTAWNSLRTICRAEIFSARTLDAQSGLREKKVMELIDHFKAKKGKVVDVGEAVLTTMFNIFGNLVFSTDLISLSNESKDEPIKVVMRTLMTTMTAKNLADCFPILSKFDPQGLRAKMLNLIYKFRAIWGPIIDERRKTGAASPPNDLLDILIHNDFTDPRIHQLVLELFTAGIDTTTSTIEWAVAELVKKPDSMKKVCEELDKEFNLENVKEPRLLQLPYLQACMKETLRLHPAVPLLLHRAPEECQVLNYRIPKNSRVVVNLLAVGRDPLAWDEPSKFRPERFLDATIDFKGSNFGYIPFGAGRRICPGFPMALRNVPLFVAAIVHSFDWSLPEGKDPLQLDMTESFGLTMKKEEPLLLIPEPRI